MTITRTTVEKKSRSEKWKWTLLSIWDIRVKKVDAIANPITLDYSCAFASKWIFLQVFFVTGCRHHNNLCEIDNGVGWGVINWDVCIQYSHTAELERQHDPAPFTFGLTVKLLLWVDDLLSRAVTKNTSTFFPLSSSSSAQPVASVSPVLRRGKRGAPPWDGTVLLSF